MTISNIVFKNSKRAATEWQEPAGEALADDATGKWGMGRQLGSSARQSNQCSLGAVGQPARSKLVRACECNRL